MPNYESFLEKKNYRASDDMEPSVIEFYDYFGIKLIKNLNIKGIDLLEINGLFGVEVEQSNCVGDYWEHPLSKVKARGLSYPTINFSSRKYKYWYEGIKDYASPPSMLEILENEDKGIFKPNNQNNLYIRGNIDRTQMIVIKPETIKDKEKRIILEYSVNNNFITEDNGNKKYIPETWLLFRREHVQTWNKINGIFVLEKY